MSTYNIVRTSILVASRPADLLRLSFGTPAQNDAIVRDASQAIADLNLAGGELVLLNGPASLPVACAIAHGIGHLYKGVGVFDPKMAGYVLAIAHGGEFTLGQVIPASEVKEVVEVKTQASALGGSCDD